MASHPHPFAGAQPSSNGILEKYDPTLLCYFTLIVCAPPSSTVKLGNVLYHTISKLHKVNRGKKRNYLRHHFVHAIVSKQGLPFTASEVRNALKALDRREPKSQTAAIQRSKWIPVDGSVSVYNNKRAMRPREKKQYRASCCYSVSISVNQSRGRGSPCIRVKVDCPWSVLKKTTFVCTTTSERLEEKVDVDSNNTCVLPRRIVEAIFAGDALHVRQHLELHYSSADLNHLLHICFPDHDPITGVVVTYTVERSEPNLAPILVPYHNVAPPPATYGHALHCAEPPSWSPFPAQVCHPATLLLQGYTPHNLSVFEDRFSPGPNHRDIGVRMTQSSNLDAEWNPTDGSSWSFLSQQHEGEHQIRTMAASPHTAFSAPLNPLLSYPFTSL
ncbi:hypothetical protein NMY22_g10749 [Coprinellus aureogranulatus]|nr:hypothetical protein NMY22_g10749 [Coprinellus aureogranulatus]